MDAHLLIKIVHMSSASLLILAIVIGVYALFVGTQGDQPNPKTRKFFVGLQHFSYLLIILTGITLLFMNHFEVKPWFYAKVVLFLVVISSLLKAFKKDTNILLTQRRAGMVIGIVALAALLSLVMIKPVFG
ncbi:SirB2 family protein [Acinetobacter sp. 194]|uniref:SirB2 family protein n=1 Tax=Acinetobacter shaoyimingii TaxID=2715164 RepID=UPI00140E47F2|nr:SirB2 family protein [Acinetobacter shaoyimingii]NHB56927.1 SirB2 family protein [Acinetobacter shaoyimingii]